MALNTVSSDRLSTNVKNTNFTAAEKQDLTNDILPLAGQLGNRNKIINGAMQISQRNGTSSTNIEGNTTKYHLDRFSIQGNALDELSAGVAQSTDAPDGFAHSMKITVNTPESAIANNEFVTVYQKMEGQDFQDLAYGTSGAKDITMSFYVKSSITGTFGFTVYRDEPGTDRIVNKTYTINSANTWERKTITIAGDTGRAIQKTNGSVWWNCWHLAAGSDYDSVTSSTWANYTTTNWAGGATDTVITTNGATWAITGVQLETGSVVTDFEHRTFGKELALCQRYFVQDFASSIGTMYESHSGPNGKFATFNFPVQMRAAPTVNTTNGVDGVVNSQFDNGSGGAVTVSKHASKSSVYFYNVNTAFQLTGLTNGSPGVSFSAEL